MEELTIPQFSALYGRGPSTVYKWLEVTGFARRVPPTLAGKNLSSTS